MADEDQLEPELEEAQLPQETQEPEAPVEQPAPTESAIRDYLSGKGYDMGSFEDDGQVLEQFERLATEAADLPQLRQYAGLGRQMAELQSDPEFQEWQASRSRQKEASDEAKPDEFDLDSHFSNLWKAPEFDQQWLSLVEEDPDTGRLTARVGRGGVPLASPEIVERANQYATWYRDTQREFLQNPFRQTYDAIKEPLLREVKALLGSEFEQRQADWRRQQAAQSLDGYVRDPGKGILDASGALTAKGKELESLLNDGVSEERAMALVERLHPSEAGEEGEPPVQKPATAKERNAARKETFLKRAAREAGETRQGNRDATVASAARNGLPQNDKLDFGEMLARDMKEAGFQLNGG